MYQYKLYGLNISSSRKIHLLKESKFLRSDLEVHWEISNLKTPDNTLEWEPIKTDFLEKISTITLWKAKTQNGFFTKVTFEREDRENLNFLLDSHRKKLSIYYREGDPASDLESYFVGPVMGFTMRLREVICLHSSVVGIEGKAIAFLGHSTAGKSTLAAGMADAGAEILADDVGVLTPTDDGFLVQPGYAKVRLRPKAAEFLTDDPESLPIVYSSRVSRYFSLENGNKFHAAPLPLTAIYILGEISDDYRNPFIKPINSQDKLINLIPNTIGSYVVTGELRAKEFQILAKIAKTIPMRKLHYAHDITTLPRQCQVILEDFKAI